MHHKKAMPVTSIKPDPKVWAQALASVEGDARRLEVVDERTVIVHNSAHQRSSTRR